jgi:predicted 3-demethylubiquinone-9 3-methyltransferase (glyoxalase superfamily)
MQFPSKIVPCLWFDDRAEEAARFYTGIFPDARIVAITHYPEVGQEVHGQPAGKVLTVEFELAGQRFTALNGGPHFKFSEAISLQIMVDSQRELETYWNALSAVPEAEQCGWLKDKFGLSWQVSPTGMIAMLQDPDKAKVNRVFQAMLGMKKIDIAALERAFEGK